MNREETEEEISLLTAEELRERISLLRAHIDNCKFMAANAPMPYWKYLFTRKADVLEERKEYLCDRLELNQLEGDDYVCQRLWMSLNESESFRWVTLNQ